MRKNFSFGHLALFIERDRTISLTLKHSGISIPFSVAHDMAHWILENTPEKICRVYDDDMKNLARATLESIGVLEYLCEDSYSLLKFVLNSIDWKPEENVLYSEDQCDYVKFLLGNLPQWIRDRVLSTKGELA